MMESKYKETEIGLYPNDWEVRPLGSCLSIGHGRDYKHLKNGDVPVYGTGGLMASVSEFLYEGSTVCIGRKGTIDAPQYHEGKIWTVDTLFYTHSFINCVPKYIYYVFNTIDWYSYNEATGVPSLTSKAIEKILIALPPSIEEQKLIVNALDDMGKLISSIEKLIEKKCYLKIATMQQLFSGVKRINGYSDSWIDVQLSEMGYTYNGLSGKSASDFGHGQAKYVTFLNVLNNPIIDCSIFESVDVKDGERQNDVQKGDLLFNTSSETPEEVGICATLDENIEGLYLNSFCFGYRLKSEYSPKFLAYFFRSKQGRELMKTLAQGSTRYNLSKDNLMKSSITIPQTKEEQDAIATVLSDMDKEIAQLESRKSKYEAIKQGMMQQLLTGKIRLIN